MRSFAWLHFAKNVREHFYPNWEAYRHHRYLKSAIGRFQFCFVVCNSLPVLCYAWGNRVFSRDVGTATMFVSSTNPPEIQFYSYAGIFFLFCLKKHAHWSAENTLLYFNFWIAAKSVLLWLLLSIFGRSVWYPVMFNILICIFAHINSFVVRSVLLDFSYQWEKNGDKFH